MGEVGLEAVFGDDRDPTPRHLLAQRHKREQANGSGADDEYMLVVDDGGPTHRPQRARQRLDNHRGLVAQPFGDGVELGDVGDE